MAPKAVKSTAKAPPMDAGPPHVRRFSKAALAARQCGAWTPIQLIFAPGDCLKAEHAHEEDGEEMEEDTFHGAPPDAKWNVNDLV